MEFVENKDKIWSLKEKKSIEKQRKKSLIKEKLEKQVFHNIAH